MHHSTLIPMEDKYMEYVVMCHHPLSVDIAIRSWHSFLLSSEVASKLLAKRVLESNSQLKFVP